MNPQLAALALAAAAVAVPALAQAPGTAFRDCADCPEMVVVPGGNFRMGSPREQALSSFEAPARKVTIGQAFAVGRFEITRGQFAAFVRDSGYAAFTGKGCIVLRHLDMQWVHEEPRNWRDPGYAQEDDHPVVCVSWEDAKAFTDWISKKTGKGFRLLSEAEWEYAALAGAAERPWGDEEKHACRHANVWDETYAKQKGLPRAADVTSRMLGSGGRGSGSQPFEGKGAAELWYRNSVWCSDAHALTSPVGKFQPNRFGLHDTIGNAWEWVEDCMNASYVDAPEDGSVWRTGNCGHRVMRGGSWSSVAVDARANKRLFRELSVRRADLGFRIARNL